MQAVPEHIQESDEGPAAVRSAWDRLDAVEEPKSSYPSVVLLDLQSPTIHELAATGRMMTDCPATVIVSGASDGVDGRSPIHAPGSGAVDSILNPNEQRSDKIKGAVKLPAFGRTQALNRMNAPRLEKLCGPARSDVAGMKTIALAAFAEE